MVQGTEREQTWSLISLPDCPVAVVAARVPSARTDDNTPRYASGWGESPEEASRKCALEVIERHSAQFFGSEEVTRCAATALGSTAVSPADIMLFAESQYDAHETRRAREANPEDFPIRWSIETPIDWVRATDALSSEAASLPAGLCFLGHGRDRALGLVPADTNGLAAGNGPSDAAVRAFVELVERDAVAIWWYNRLIRPQVDLADVDDPLPTRYAEWSRLSGRLVRLIDLTHDCGIPVLAAVAHDRSGRHIAMGFGAGSSAAHAARHAIGELAQFECNISLIERRVGARGEAGVTDEALNLLRWWRDASVGDHRYLGDLMTADPPPTRSALDLQTCHDICATMNAPFLALDLTRSGDGPAVVRVFGPGLRPMWPRFAPGRLFDVPVRLGWRSRPSDLDELNPTPIMF